MMWQRLWLLFVVGGLAFVAHVAYQVVIKL